MNRTPSNTENMETTVHYLIPNPRYHSTGIMAPTVSSMSCEELAKLLQTPSDAIAIIDVRDEDCIGGHIKGSVNVPSRSLDHKWPELLRTLKDKEKVVFHCSLSQMRGPKAAKRYLFERERLEELSGHGNDAGGKDEGSASDSCGERKQQVYLLEGGFVKWQERCGSPSCLACFDIDCTTDIAGGL